MSEFSTKYVEAAFFRASSYEETDSELQLNRVGRKVYKYLDQYNSK